MKLPEFFNTLAYAKDKRKEQAEMIHRLIKGKTAEEANVILLSYLIQK